MIYTVQNILDNEVFTRENLIKLLMSTGDDLQLLYNKSNAIKNEYIGNKVHFRGLIEFSNVCSKDCFYCGIRKSNKATKRYNLSDDEIIEAAEFANRFNYGSVVLQSGEIESKAFTLRIENLLRQIKESTEGNLGITLSIGEQSKETYERWFESGAHRYLLRIESSNSELFKKIHPDNINHDFDRRLKCLKDLQEIGYQTGTGVMIGLPFQDYGILADDLLFFRDMDFDMIGMGPYIEHEETPLYEFRNMLLPLNDRFTLALKMIAILRIMQKDINIAAATALQAIDPIGREKAIKIGANIIMPNITPAIVRANYQLYRNKPCIDESAYHCINCLEARIKFAGDEIGYNEWGDSKHFFKRRERVK